MQQNYCSKKTPAHTDVPVSTLQQLQIPSTSGRLHSPSSRSHKHPGDLSLKAWLLLHCVGLVPEGAATACAAVCTEREDSKSLSFTLISQCHFRSSKSHCRVNSDPAAGPPAAKMVSQGHTRLE